MSVLVHRVQKRYTFKSQGGEALADRTSLTATLFLKIKCMYQARKESSDECV